MTEVLFPLLIPISIFSNLGELFLSTFKIPFSPFSVTIETVGTRIFSS
ncbi:uncharacterized protein METZ01_LOCUS406918, partial [marine metagenome]